MLTALGYKPLRVRARTQGSTVKDFTASARSHMSLQEGTPFKYHFLFSSEHYQRFPPKHTEPRTISRSTTMLLNAARTHQLPEDATHCSPAHPMRGVSD